MKAPQPENELERLIELSEMDLDYTNLQDDLGDLVELAAHVVGTNVSLINLIDSFTQWSVADHGIDLQQMPREDSVCQYTIIDNDPLEVEDLSQDERFLDKSYVKGEPGLRYYYGIPLTTSTGVNIGALCVLDSERKTITPEKEKLLEMIANQVVRRLAALKKINDLSDEVESLQTKTKKVSHDLRNPLSGIVGLAELMEEEIKNERVNDLLDLAKMIRKGGNNLLELIEDIMESEENTQNVPAKHEFSCDTFCQKLEEMYLPQAKSKGVNLNISSSGNTRSFFFPKSRLLQIVGNLISNSIKFTDEGGSVDVHIQLIANSQQNRIDLLIEVSDTGIGMEKEKIEEIFSGEFASNKGTQGEVGYGFGLKLVNHLVDKANGTIDVESEPGVGTEFKIQIPVA